MARVLFLSQVLPYPLDAGPKVRSYYMLRQLARGRQVTLAAFTRPDDPPGAAAHLAEFCQNVVTVPMQRSLVRNLRAGVKGLATGLPVVIVRDEMDAMFALLQRLVAESTFDLVHADQLAMAGYGQFAARRAAQRPRTLLDEHNAVYWLVQRMVLAEKNLIRRALMAREAAAFARYEAAMCRAYDAVLTVTAEDRTHLLTLLAREKPVAPERFSVIPITVDPESTPVVARQPAASPTILHLGTMFWPPNVQGVLWFAQEVLPLIHQRLPTARFVVVGKNPPPKVLALAADSRIEITGYVADPTPYLAAADVFVAPLAAGGGMRVKILDAWLWGLPVVATRIGAEGIAYVPDEHLLLASEPTGFAAATLRLLTDTVDNERLRRNGRAWVERVYAWQQVYAKVDQVYDRLLNPGEQP